ncbi:hypothetical protein [Streptomyces sp. NPDC057250]|uniref:hypothetical protein n=1 Tax=Streptomyces sp. NPDC057250 TaxID=3346068 RepID=UPI003628D02B
MSAVARLLGRLLPAPAPASAVAAAPLTYPYDDVDALELGYCPVEEDRRPHAVAEDGARRCWTCGHDTPGEL